MLEISWLLRLLHILAATAWVGGSLMYQFVIMPALRKAGPLPAVSAQIAINFKRLTNLCITVLLLTGAYLTFDRLTQTTLGLSYIVVLLCKILIALIAFILAFYVGQSPIRRLARRATTFSRLSPQIVLALGVLVFILGALLNALFEASLASH
ncbi:hypothetical protein [Tengunoibacter tsumagoiensis]|uniref:Copper resistance protein D domain-containing protein n=1 Tax=Tengunoibacter tsumagoiensis TaxID=2014871 RepID=A0A402A5K1_9CHLR|nr:hypothetical protein [Tengunoibacter tsumagoiensis]GCE14380.1 hypothetical protein KTT_42390 [Tengunoibacter tsumagoiensis]